MLIHLHLASCLRDAQDAVRGRDGYDFDGSRLRVELARGDRRMGGGGGGGAGFDVPRGRAVPPPLPRGGFNKGSKYRIMVKNLPQSASWQDLKVRLPPTRSQAPRDGACGPSAHAATTLLPVTVSITI
jgi:hypothetical protein